MSEEDILIADGLEEAFVGVAQQFNTRFAVYDKEQVLKGYVKEGMSDEEAEEYFQFNVQGAWVGSTTPAFITRCRIEDIYDD
jgi:tellurite resistance-related uncharacterized protein